MQILAAPSVEQNLSVTFHVARDPEFLQGIRDGRSFLPQDWNLQGKDGWWNLEELLSFVHTELSSESQAKENQVRECFEAAPHTPIYNLGLVAGFLSTLAAAARQSSELSRTVQETFTIGHPAFVNGLQQGAMLYEQEHGSLSFLSDTDLLSFYEQYLTPFHLDALGNTGVMLGWMRAFLSCGGYVDFTSQNLDFLAGYHIAAHDWLLWKKDELLTDEGFADCLANEVSLSTLIVMHAAEPWYTYPYQIGYAFGLVKGLLSSPTIQFAEDPGKRG